MRALVLTLVVACAHEPAARPAASPAKPSTATPLPERGTPADVHTHAGMYDGYEVDDRCREEGTRGVRGLGTRGMPPIVGDGHDFEVWATALRRDAERALAPSVVGVGFGIGCRDDDRAFRVYVGTFGEIDGVTERLGSFIRDRDLGVRFVILLSPRIVPL